MIIVAAVFVLGTLICYSCCVVSARADRQSERYAKNREEEEYHGKHFKDE